LISHSNQQLKPTCGGFFDESRPGLKLARRLTFCRRALLDQWVLLEADPAVIAFCERPGYIKFGGQQYLSDFWVRYVGRQELVILSDSTAVSDVAVDADPDVTAPCCLRRRIGSSCGFFWRVFVTRACKQCWP
jgi:hypothetical protein